jgi:hypothetical protein
MSRNKRRWIVEIELIDREGSWEVEELPELERRLRAALMWHKIPADLFSQVGDVKARKG